MSLCKNYGCIRRSRSNRRKTGLSNPSDRVFAFNGQVIAKTLAELTKEVVINMEEEGYRGQTVSLKIRFNDFKTYTRAKTLSRHTDSEEKIRKAAFDCLGMLELKKKVRLIGVRMSHLTKVGERIPL
jgi:DNA polymerase-4